MKSVNKLFKKRRSKIGTAAKILIPAAGVVAAKKLWDNKENLISDNVRSKVLEKTEVVQDKVNQFHDFIQNSADEPVESVFVDEEKKETTETGEEINVTPNAATEEDVEQTAESNENLSSKAE